MKVKELLKTIENGSAHIILVNHETGEIILKTIWHNGIPEKELNKEILKSKITDYTITLEVL